MNTNALGKEEIIQEERREIGIKLFFEAGLRCSDNADM
jgi:hypothetical protein